MKDEPYNILNIQEECMRALNCKQGHDPEPINIAKALLCLCNEIVKIREKLDEI